MAAYDPSIIHQFAERMYRQAFLIEILTALSGLIALGLVGYGMSNGKVFWAILLGLVGGFLGYLLGVLQAFWFRFAAQLALCLAEIEFNTRKGKPAPY